MTATATLTAPTQQAAKRAPLFAKPIPIIGCTGEFESGKTRFLLSIAPGPDTLIFDSETSSETYEEIGCKRVDIPLEMMRLMPGGYKPVDVFTWWSALVKTIPAGRYRVIAIDVVEDLENGLADWVWENPLSFNHTKAQYMRMSGLYWGDVKNYWKSLLLDIRSRCEVFAFAVHLGKVWGSDSKPIVGQSRPKGKLTLSELATLFLHLERPIQADGSKSEVPTARVLKSRLSHNSVVNGSLITKAILPPRLPQCTVEAIREYIARPADYTHLAAAERDVPVQMSADERAQLRFATASAEADAERAKLERMAEERKLGGSTTSGHTVHVDVSLDGQDTPPDAAPENADPPASPAAITAAQPSQSPALVSSVRSLWNEYTDAMGLAAEARGPAFSGVLSRYNVGGPDELTDTQLAEIEAKLREKLATATQPGVNGTHGGLSATPAAPPATPPAAMDIPAAVPSAHPAKPPIADRILAAISDEVEPVSLTDLAAIIESNSAATAKAIKKLVTDGKVMLHRGKVMLPAMAGEWPPDGAAEAGAVATANVMASADIPAADVPPTAAPITTPTKTVLPPGYVRPACLAPTVRASVLALWEELAHLMGWSFDEKTNVWQTAILAKYGAVSGNELTDADLYEVERQLVRKIHQNYVDRGNAEASPFRAEDIT